MNLYELPSGYLNSNGGYCTRGNAAWRVAQRIFCSQSGTIRHHRAPSRAVSDSTAVQQEKKQGRQHNPETRGSTHRATTFHNERFDLDRPIDRITAPVWLRGGRGERATKRGMVTGDKESSRRSFVTTSGGRTCGDGGIELTVDFSVIAAYCGHGEQVEIKQHELVRRRWLARKGNKSNREELDEQPPTLSCLWL